MHLHIADQYLHGESFIHRLDPRTKVSLTLAFILSLSLLPFGAFAAYGVLLVVVLSLIFVSGVGFWYVLKRTLIALPFALAAVTLPFTVPGESLTTLPLFGGLTISQEGSVRFISIVAKSWISVQMAILLVSVTPFPQLLWGLRALHVPQPLVGVVSFMYRYLFVLSDEVLRLLRARAARSAKVEGQRSGGNVFWRGKVAGQMAGSLMLRSFERSERIYSAMVARGFQGQIRLLSQSRFQYRDYLAFVLMIGLLAIVIWFSYAAS